MENMLCSWNPRPPCPSIHLFACLSPSSVCLSSSLGACPLLAPLSGTCFLCCSCLVLSPLFWLPKARLGASLGRLSFPVFAHRHGSGTSSVLNSAQHSVLRRSARRPPIPPTPVLCLAACGGTTYATTAPNLKTSRPHPHTREPVSSLHWTARRPSWWRYKTSGDGYKEKRRRTWAAELLVSCENNLEASMSTVAA